MKRIEIEVTHIYKNKFVGRRRLKPGDDMTIIGSTKESHLRLMGEGVSTVHATIEHSEDKWTISDLGSEQGTWLRKNPIVCQEIDQNLSIRIGGHVLKLVPKVIESHLFVADSSKKKDKKTAAPSGQPYHQVIVKKNSFVVSSELLDPNESYAYDNSGEQLVLAPPTSGEWVKTDLGDVSILQRVTHTNIVQTSGMEKVQATLWDPSLKKPMSLALVLMLIISGLMIFAPEKPSEELTELKSEKQNRYTRIIYDAKAAKKRRKAANKMHNKMVSKNRKMSSPKKSVKLKVAGRVSSKSSKVRTRIKVAGLSQLIGKISKRAAKSARFIKAAGRTPDKASGRALASIGGVSGKTAKFNSGKSFKVKGVSTAGLAGGSASFKGVGGLSLGNIGNATVGILDEETDVQGGLDKDVIARYIETQLGQIRYCYERQLSANPGLYGKVMIKFTIAGNGGVVAQNIGLTTLKSAMVEGCILRRVSGWRFPQPKGGTKVLVSYPFLFKSTN